MNNEIIDVEEYEIVKSLPERVAEIKAIEAMASQVAIEAIVRIGHQLKLCKEEVPHGEWTTWCEENLGYSQRQAQKYMELSERYSDETGINLKTNTYSFLSVSKAYKLLALPEEEVGKFVEKHDVEDMTVKKLEEEVRKVNDELEAAQREIEAGKALATTFDEELAQKEESIEQLENRLDAMKQLSSASPDSEKQKAKIKSLEEELRKEKEKAQGLRAEKEKAVTDAKATANKELEAAKKDLAKAKEESEKRIEEALKKAKATADPSVNEFKIRTDILQTDFNACVNSISSAETEMQPKLKAALQKMMEQLTGRIAE